MIFLATISTVGVFFWVSELNSLTYTTASLIVTPIQQINDVIGTNKVNTIKDTTASLIVEPIQQANDAIGAKVIVANQINTIDAPLPEHLNAGISLKIPKINVDAKIYSMGVTKDGAMESPSDSQDVGWFSFGPRPGENGSAVLAGHYGRWKNRDVSIFDNLHTLKPGDKLYVEDKDGVTITFIVRQLKTYDKDGDTSEVFAFDDGAPHLNIIACAGVYDENLKTYSNRLVVFTDKQ